jgi:hypothetical protein
MQLCPTLRFALRRLLSRPHDLFNYRRKTADHEHAPTLSKDAAKIGAKTAMIATARKTEMNEADI